jgi:fatty-acyl-CoA synthase
MTDAPPTIDELVRRQHGVESIALRFEDRAWTWAEWVDACTQRAAYLVANRRPGPLHVGILLDNTPEFTFWLGAAALARAAVVGINPTRRGDDLARDVRHTDCQLVVTESRHASLLEGIDMGVGRDRVLDIDTPAYRDALAPFRGATFPDERATPGDLVLLLFTSGTTGAPKAVRCTQGKLWFVGAVLSEKYALGPESVCYLAMPMFHSNALMAGWAPALTAGATMALRRRFSASGFLPDVRRFGVTYFNYVGKPLAYILATPEQPDDGHTTLRDVFGNEAPEADRRRFAARFGCTVTDGYGSTEGGTSITWSSDTPPGALGPAPDGLLVVDPDSGEERPRARLDGNGQLLNGEEAIGELVSTTGRGAFEGYYKNDDAETQRMRNGWYWTGDLGYVDEQGFVWFAGRGTDWLRVDGENLGAAPIERVLGRHPDVVAAAVYAVPDPIVGDQVMAALELRPGATFDPTAFAAFLAAQPDMGTKWSPRYVRIGSLPMTESNKILKRQLQHEQWHTTDPVWHRETRDGPYVRAN